MIILSGLLYSTTADNAQERGHQLATSSVWQEGRPASSDFAGFAETSSNPKIHFRKLGTTSAATEYAHLKIPFNLTQIQALLDTADAHAHHATVYDKANGDTDFATHHTTSLWQEERIESLRRRLIKLQQVSIPPPKYARLQKRELFTVLAIIAAAATAGAALTVGVYTQLEVDSLNTKMEDLATAELEKMEQIRRLHAGTLDISVATHTLARVMKQNTAPQYKLLWLTKVLDIVAHHIQLSEQALRTALASRLDISVLQGLNLTDIIADLDDHAQTHRLRLISQSGHDFLHLPTSLSASKDGFAIITHIPLIREGSLMQVYQHIPLPMPVNDDLYLTLSTSHDILAVNDDRTAYIVSNVAQLSADCTRLGSFYACPRGNGARRHSASRASRKDDPAGCLFALFTQDHDAADTSCIKSFVVPGPDVYQISARTFITYGQTTGTIDCRDSPISGQFSTTGYGSITLPPGCTATSDEFILSSSDSAYTREEDAWETSAQLQVNASFFLDNDLDHGQLAKLVKDTSNIMSNMSRISFDTARYHLDKVVRKSHFHIWDMVAPYASPSALAMAGLNLIFSCYLLARLSKHQPPRPDSSPLQLTAQAVQMALISKTPHDIVLPDF